MPGDLRDGLKWDKPNLGLVEYRGSKSNNIIPRESFKDYMFLDDHEKDPARRYKGLAGTGTTTTPGMTFDLYFSPDGFKWTPYEKNPTISTPLPDRSLGADDLHGMGPHTEGLRRPHGELPAALSAGEANDRSRREPRHGPLERTRDDDRPRRGRHA